MDDFEKLGQKLNLDKLTEKFLKNDDTQPNKKHFSRPEKVFLDNWQTLVDKKDVKVTIHIDRELSGDEARQVMAALYTWQHLHAIGATTLTQNEFITDMLLRGAQEIAVFGSLFVREAKAKKAYVDHVRANPEEFRKHVEDVIHGRGDFAEFSEEE